MMRVIDDVNVDIYVIICYFLMKSFVADNDGNLNDKKNIQYINKPCTNLL